MPKFYVLSGDLQTVLDRDSSYQAAVDAFRNVLYNDDVNGLSWLVKVSELGFESVNEDDVIFLTQGLLDDAGMGDEFFHNFPDQAIP